MTLPVFINRLVRRLVPALLGLCFAASALAEPSAPARQLGALFEAHWQWTMRNHPEWATALGDHRFDQRWTDNSDAAIAQREAHAREMLARVQRIARTQLSGVDRVSYDVFTHQQRMAVQAQQFPVLRTRVLSAMDGIHLGLSEVMKDMPMRSEAGARNLLARLSAYPARVQQDIALLKEGARLGWVTHQGSLARVPEQIDAQLADDVRQSPLFAPFKDLLTTPNSELSPEQRAELAAAGERALIEKVQPALRELRRFVVDALLPRSPESGALSGYPGGTAVYAYAVREQTTTDMNVQAIHDLGLKEVARLRAEMETTMARSGFNGSFGEFVAFLNSDPKFFYTSGTDLLAGYRDIAKRVDPELPKLFAELPRAPYGIRPIDAHHGEGRAEFYNSPAADGSRPGWFNANVVALKTRPKWEMESLFLHEAVPGHHLQTARALELGALPMFRRSAWYVAYGEGWALYAEGLGEQLGLYTDAYSKFGQQRAEIWRAARLAVDTGIHALGWTRQQAIDWMTERTGIARDDVISEVDRYYVWPGQALGYKIGQLKLVELRERARKALGERFDLRRFHMAVLDHGAVPLNVLEQLLDEWIAAERRLGQTKAGRR
jgi:uncharacterized protein (DUF885 family)